MTPAPPEPRIGQIAGWLAAATLGLAIIFGVGKMQEAETQPAPVASAEPVSAEVRQGCKDALARAMLSGIVRGRPSPERADVDDLAWHRMTAEDKRALLGLVACAAHGKRPADLGPDEHAVAYGYRSGKRLAMLSVAGFDFE